MPHAPHAVVVLWPRKSGHTNKGFCSVTPNVKWLPAFVHVHDFSTKYDNNAPKW
jgi:hypothetical protein